MRIIKPHGRSIVKRVDGGLKRRIDVGARARNTTVETGGEPDIDVLTFQKNSSAVFIADWTYSLDKLLKKPNKQGQKPGKLTREAREKAGDAFLNYWIVNKNKPFIPNNVDEEDFKTKWNNKVHPYGEGVREQKEKSVKTGKLYGQLFGNKTVNNLNKNDWKELPEKVYKHLYEQQQKVAGSKKGKQGFVQSRADSITKNARRYQNRNENLQSLSHTEQRHIQALQDENIFNDWESYKSKYKLDELVDDLKDKESISAKERKEKDKDKYTIPATKVPCLPRGKAIASLYAHYAKIFKASESDQILTVSDAGQQKPDLWQYHKMIKEALYQRYPKRLNSKKNHQGQYPVSSQELHNLAVSIEKNRQIAFAIRLGKVIHYEGGLEKANSENIDKIVESDYWTSKGQTEIKQSESFVRQWLGAIAIANTSLERLVDPERKIDNDLFLKEPFRKAIKQLNQIAPDFNIQFELLFGEGHGLYEGEEQRKMLMILLQSTLSQLRHASFHFKKIDDFITALEEVPKKFDSEKKDLKKEIENYIKSRKVEEYIKSQQAIQQQQILNELRSAGVEQYFEEDDLKRLLSHIENKERNLLPLPKFNKLLLRAKNLIEDKNIYWELLRPVSITEMEYKAYRCCFICLKILYEHDFGQWLRDREQDTTTVNKWINAAKDYATKRAKGNHQKHSLPGEEIQSRMSHLRNYREGSNNSEETLLGYFSYWTAETASQFMVQQNTYHSNKEAAKEQSNFVEDLKQDTLIGAFKAYLTEVKLGFLIEPDKLKPDKELTLSSSTDSFPQAIVHPWFYMALHLIPCEYINHLALEIKKHHVLTQEQNYEEIYRAISLFLDVHNADLGITSLSDAEKLDVFYKDKKKFKALFLSNNQDDSRMQLIPVRGLRELLRYGNLRQLEKLFEKNKVASTSVRALEEMRQDNVSGIAQKQALRQKWHSDLVEKKNISSAKVNDHSQLKDYQQCLQYIIGYRELKNHVYLHHPKQAHQLIMAISGRLLGFSQVWERDIYFVMLSLFFLRHVRADQYAAQPYFRQQINTGQIITAIYKLEKIDNETIKTIVGELQGLFSISEKQNGYINIVIRNNLAHFNALRKNELINFTELINKVRRLMRYDRKMKNAVSRAIIELMERHNLILDFHMSNHQLIFKGLSAQTIHHFGNKDISEKLHSDTYVEVIKQLFIDSANGKQTGTADK